MTKILNVNNICDAITQSQMPGATKHIRALEKAATAAAKALADHYGIVSGEGDYQGGFGGLCVNFKPAHEGQECPDVIEEGDEGGEWE